MFTATILVFSVIILISIVFFIAYLMFGLDSSSASKVDPAPENKIVWYLAKNLSLYGS